MHCLQSQFLFHSVVIEVASEHSMKCLRVIEGKRLISAIENFLAVSTMPCNDKRVLGGIDGRNAAVMTFEVKSGCGEIAEHLVERRHAPGGILHSLVGKPTRFRFELRA